ncbi:efflux RND transporter periplasmic adaptor subunit [Colwellia sp. M166]|uniref:efflux RND transporter periplasmic adaptor subunit n=1 Tax=Colwellia sp. M166 TaxID=2583805 RepID=UPI00211DF5AD|nr:efflux RND transporter periplasmic adaptor subunit [Colwellia sp. M166]UUO23455.1 efflux RND transporter periplasmic adaptor subunit [Colwellia sp. M166]|tara:strand:- start:63009 stop:64001 length:993 start_codon:yes stop_codon:yes gene_type:complete
MKLFLIVLTLLLISLTKPLIAQSFDTEMISAELYTNTIQRTGKLDYKRTLSLSFKSAGYLALLSVDEGEAFDQGQLLAALDVTELKENKNSYYAQLTQAKRDVKRISGLLDEKLASERDMDTAITQVETIRAAYQVAYYNLEKAQIYAPFSGVVLARNTELGELQSPGQEALKVAKLDWVVKVALTGQEISQVYLGQNVRVSISHMGIVDGTVSKIPALANSGDNLFTIEVLLPEMNITSAMIAGQLAGVSIAFESDKFVYRLPIAALVAVDDDGKAIVIAQSPESSDFKQYRFSVLQLDNDYVYLQANRNDEALKVVTKGWQNYSLARP